MIVMQFPSMASLQGALPNTAAPSGLLHTPNYGASPYHPSMRAQVPSFAPTNPTSKRSYLYSCKVLLQQHGCIIFVCAY